MAQDLDREAAFYIQTELMAREAEREKRDREFWIAALGGESNGEPEIDIKLEEGSLEDSMHRSALAR